MPDAHTVDQVLRRQAERYPAKPMIIDPDARLTYAELDSTTRRLAAGFLAAGMTKGSRVGLLMPNGTNWIALAFAAMRVGVVLVPLSTLLRGHELVAQLRVASVQHLITVPEFRGRHYLDELGATLDITDLAPGVFRHDKLPALQSIWSADQIAAADTGSISEEFVDALASTVRPSDVLAILFTSGSSGPPKAIIHSHGNAFAAVESGLTGRCITADTRLYLPMPFFWIGGFGAGVLATLAAGATLVTESTATPESTLALLAREGVTLFRGWPDQAEALARHVDPAGQQLSSLRVGSLEALLPPALRSQPGARAALFGMTESFGPYCGFPADTDMPRSAWGSCGLPFPGMQVRIVDAATGVPVPIGAIGAIQIRGPHLMRGIYRRDRSEVFTADGFYPTGDLGYLDADGFLFYRGRSDDMFKVSGASVYPSEVERALRGIAGVAGAFVTNVPIAQGNRVGAVVVCDTAVTTVDQLRGSLREVLSSFKVPSVWLLVDDAGTIVRGASGKVDIPALRAMLAAHLRTTLDHYVDPA